MDTLYSEDLRNSDTSWVNRITSEQREINDWLVPQLNKQNKILFVGTGNSSLALEACNSLNCIDGVTIIRSEFVLGVNCNLPNYNMFFLDKHSDDILSLTNKYSYIVDNNLASYAKDRESFLRMLNNYISLLENNGKIISSVTGLSYVYQGSKSGVNSLETLHKTLQDSIKIPLKVTMETDTIFSISLVEKMTFVLPSRNNLEFLQLAYKSIRDLETKHEILILDDASIDGTQEWIKSLNDEDLITYHNPGPERIGIVGMFDKGIKMARTEIIFAFHADMVACKDLDKNILKYLKPGTVVSATRVEPPLHPSGPEKITYDLGTEAEQFKINEWYSKSEELKQNKITEGIFAPWCMYKSDYLLIGGHDELFAPQSKEDSDLFNRFVLNGYKTIQSWDGLVYHFTSRGSRFNKYAGGNTGVNSKEWLYTTTKNGKEFIRKWGHFIKHDPLMKPIIPPKYDIGFIIKNCSPQLLELLEPWCSTLYTDCNYEEYIKKEQPNTKFDLYEKIKPFDNEKQNEIFVEFDGSNFIQSSFDIIQKLPEIIKHSGSVGVFELDIFRIEIIQMNEYQNKLIICNK